MRTPTSGRRAPPGRRPHRRPHTTCRPRRRSPAARGSAVPCRRSAGRPRLRRLLHGLSDDHTMWQRLTSIERYAEPLGLAVVMPAVHRSFYADEVHGHRYWTFLTEEVPALVSQFFRVSDRPGDTFVAGLSMG